MSLSVEFTNLKNNALHATVLHDHQQMDVVLNILNNTTRSAKQMSKFDRTNVERFISENKRDLYRVYYILVIQTDLFISDISQQRAIGRRFLELMHTLRIHNVKQYFERLPTYYLRDFCKGITCFNGNNVAERPFYQQELSQNLSTADVANVYKCFLERTIYNRLYEDILHYRDTHHWDELWKMERCYQVIFKGHRIVVDLFYKNQIEPTSLRITTYDVENVGNKTEEFYQKTNGGALVMCTKVIFEDHTQVAHYKKEQTMDKEEPWIQVM